MARRLFAILAAAIGIAAVVFEGYDDSPGLQVRALDGHLELVEALAVGA